MVETYKGRAVNWTFPLLCDLQRLVGDSRIIWQKNSQAEWSTLGRSGSFPCFFLFPEEFKLSKTQTEFNFSTQQYNYRKRNFVLHVKGYGSKFAATSFPVFSPTRRREPWERGCVRWWKTKITEHSPLRKGVFTWYRYEFHSGTSSSRFLLIALYLFTWYRWKISYHYNSYRYEFIPVVVPDRNSHNGMKSYTGIM